MPRVIISGGEVFDGSGAPARAADVLVEDGRVARVALPGALGAIADAGHIDATGCWVTPGFLDTISSHRRPGPAGAGGPAA